MKRKLIFLVVLALVMTAVPGFLYVGTQTVDAAPQFQKVNFVNGTVTTAALNVRQGPSVKYPIVCVLKKGQTVKIFGKIGDWYAVYEMGGGCVGAVDSTFIKVAGTSAPRTTTPSKAPSTTTPGKTTPTAPKPTPAPQSGLTADQQSLLNMVNKARADAGAGPLKTDATLMKVAQLKAKDMVDLGYFDHQSPTYGSPFDMMRQFGVTFKTAGENIAGNNTVKGAFDLWMGSEGHRKNILNPSFNYTGIGIYPSPKYGNILVQQFIGR